MAKLTDEAIDKMGKRELNAAAKARGIKYGKMSLMQIREALKKNPDAPPPDLSEILCSRHIMTHRSRYAEKEEIQRPVRDAERC